MLPAISCRNSWSRSTSGANEAQFDDAVDDAVVFDGQRRSGSSAGLMPRPDTTFT